MNKHYWRDEEILFLTRYFPHFGTNYVAKGLSIPRMKVKSKADKLGLIMLPKNERECIECGRGKQFARRAGYYCEFCYKKNKNFKRRNIIDVRQRLSELLCSARRRSSIKCDISLDYLTEVWNKQNGKCYYSGVDMKFAGWKQKRDPYTVSIDQIKPNEGYTKNNIALCCWAVNAGKSNFKFNDYWNICKAVVEYRKEEA